MRIRYFLLAIIIFWTSPTLALKLSLEEAIFLAVRENPSVQQVQLAQVLQKFSLQVAQWQFEPHYSFNASRAFTRSVTNGAYQPFLNNFTVSPGMTWTTPIGTQITLTSTNSATHPGGYNPALSLQFVQPLIQGFGRPVVEATLNNAIDSERISRLNVESVLRITVTGVIIAYLNVISAEQTLAVDQAALHRAEESVQQTKLFIKAGRKAGVELVTVEADVASAKTTIENDKNALTQASYALLSAIGIDPNTPLSFSSQDIPRLIRKYELPPLAMAKQMILANDIQYQVDQITFLGATKRALLVAEDNARWQLNLTAFDTIGNAPQNTINSATNGFFSGANQNQTVMLNLNIPIDNRQQKLAIANAKIALQQAALALKQEKWAKETSVINGWNTIESTERALHFAENAERLQRQTYAVTFKKYRYGLIDSIELQSAQTQLIARQQALVNAQIAYLSGLVNLDQLLGNTLKTWNVEVRYL